MSARRFGSVQFQGLEELVVLVVGPVLPGLGNGVGFSRFAGACGRTIETHLLWRVLGVLHATGDFNFI